MDAKAVEAEATCRHLGKMAMQYSLVDPSLARRLAHRMRQTAASERMQIADAVSKQLCCRCSAVQLPEFNCSVRVQPKRKRRRQMLALTTCRVCGQEDVVQCGERGQKGEKAEPSKEAAGAAKAHVISSALPVNKLESRLASIQTQVPAATPAKRKGFMGHIMVSNRSGDVSKVTDVQKAATSLPASTGTSGATSSTSAPQGLRTLDEGGPKKKRKKQSDSAPSQEPAPPPTKFI